MKINFRRATANDLEILDQLYTQNMQEYVELNYPWNKDLFKSKFTPHDYIVLQKQNEIIGFLKVVLESSSLYLGEIQIKPSHQNKGIGTTVLKSLILSSKFNCRRIWLQVLKGNPTIKLYERLGFIVFAETATHYKMELLFDNDKTVAD